MQEAEWMNDATITKTQMQAFRDQLCWEEKSPGTMEKYCRDVAAFAAWLGERPLTKDAAGAWKAALLAGGQAPATINAKLAALNRFFSFLGRPELRVRPLRIQRRLFRDDRRDLTREEYDRLLGAARALGRERLALLLESLRVLKKGGVFVLHDNMKPQMYGDMNAFVEELRGMGFAEVQYVETAEKIFGSKQRAAMMMLGDSAMIVGRK